MKRIIFIFGFLVCGSIISAQPWLSKLPQGKSIDKLTLYDYQKAFEDYWAPFNILSAQGFTC